MDMRHTPFHEMVDAQLSGALNRPGLSHVETRINTCTGDSFVSAKIDFVASRQSLGLTLLVNTDQSFILVDLSDNSTKTWTAEEATPEKVTATVLDAIRLRVRAAA